MRQVGQLPRIIAWCTVNKTLKSLKIVFSLPLVPVLKLSFVVNVKSWRLIESAKVTVVSSGCCLQPYRIFKCTHWIRGWMSLSSWYSDESNNSKTRKPRPFLFLLTEDWREENQHWADWPKVVKKYSCYGRNLSFCRHMLGKILRPIGYWTLKINHVTHKKVRDV